MSVGFRHFDQGYRISLVGNRYRRGLPGALRFLEPRIAIGNILCFKIALLFNHEIEHQDLRIEALRHCFVQYRHKVAGIGKHLAHNDKFVVGTWHQIDLGSPFIAIHTQHGVSPLQFTQGNHEPIPHRKSKPLQ